MSILGKIFGSSQASSAGGDDSPMRMSDKLVAPMNVPTQFNAASSQTGGAASGIGDYKFAGPTIAKIDGVDGAPPSYGVVARMVNTVENASGARADVEVEMSARGLLHDGHPQAQQIAQSLNKFYNDSVAAPDRTATAAAPSSTAAHSAPVAPQPQAEAKPAAAMPQQPARASGPASRRMGGTYMGMRALSASAAVDNPMSMRKDPGLAAREHARTPVGGDVVAAKQQEARVAPRVQNPKLGA